MERVDERIRVELRRRRLARESLVAFSRSIIIPGAPAGDDPEAWVFEPVESGIAAHHALTMERIQACIQKPYGRLMIFEPPGSAKSTYASVVAPTWAMGLVPGLQVLATSYGSRPIERHSRRARQIAASSLYRRIFGAALKEGSRAADQWELDNGSRYYAAGLMGAITSTRCGLGIIDDPVAGRQEASSDTVRRATREAYEDDFLTRLVPGASIILIQTRWDEDDLAGSILPETWNGESGLIECRDGQTWEVLCLPAECERTDDPLGREVGEYLWPEWFDESHWAIFRKNRRTWESLYQQRPHALKGAFYSEDDLLVDGAPAEVPERMDVAYAVVDTASKTGTEHDGVGVAFWLHSRHLPYPLILYDWELRQIEGAMLETWLPTVFERLEHMCRQHRVRLGSAGVFIEDKASGIVLLQQAARNQEWAARGWRAQPIESKLTSLGKVERGINVSGYVHSGQVKIARPAVDRISEFKGAARNHMLSQVLSFDPGVKDMGADDLFDCFCYGIAIGIGGAEGF